MIYIFYLYSASGIRHKSTTLSQLLLTDDWSEVSEHVISNKDDTGTVLIAKNSSSTETVSSVGKSLNAMILDYGSRDYYNCYNRYDNGELPIGEFVPFHG